MATAQVQTAAPAGHFDSSTSTSTPTQKPQAAQEKIVVPPHDVETTLNYYKPNEDGSPPHPTVIGQPETYFRPDDTRPVTIHDISGREKEFTLDNQGFQVHRQPATEKDFVDDGQIKASYYPETEQLLKDVTGASRVFIFDHTIRRPDPTHPTGDAGVYGPVKRVHIDQSYDAALSRVPHHLPEDADRLLRGRVQIINVWRPIKTVQRDPLAVAEAASVPEADLVMVELVHPHRRGETYHVSYSPSHRWFYKSGLEPEEVLLIKCFDSKKDGRARRVPHTAFVDPASPADAPGRESIEVRALVFHEDEDHE